MPGTKKSSIFIERVFVAPREYIWKMFTDPKLVKSWWGPKLFTSPSCRIDFRVGGKYLFCMRSPEGRNYWSTGVYRKIVPMQKIVYSDSFADEKGNIVSPSYYDMSGDFQPGRTVTLTFEESGEGKTLFTLSHSGIPAGKMRENALAGWNESLDKLEGCLGGTIFTAPSGKQEVIVTRVFDSPRDRVYRTIINPEVRNKWWGPVYLNTNVEKMEVRRGGFWRIVQHDSEGNEFAFSGFYHAADRPEKLVFTSEFEGMPGHVVLETIKLEELPGGKTKMTDLTVFQSVEDRDTMLKADMERGATDSMDRLAELLKKISNSNGKRADAA